MSGITTLTIPKGTVTIKNYALDDCPKLKRIRLSSTVKKVGNINPGSLKKIESITVDKKNPYFSSKKGALFNKKKSRLIYYLNTKKTSYKVPASVRVIENGAFFDTKVRKVTLPKKLKVIGAAAFFESRIDKIVIPSKVRKIGEDAFSECPELKKVIIKTEHLTHRSVGKDAFGKLKNKVVFYVPANKRTLYESIISRKSMGTRIVIK